MNITSPILQGAAHAAALPGDSVAALLKTVGDFTGLFTDDDGSFGLAMSALAGVAAALAVAIVLTVYFRSRYRSAHRSAMRPLAGMNTARLSRYDVSATFIRTGSAPKLLAIAGRAVDSTVASSCSISNADATINAVRR